MVSKPYGGEAAMNDNVIKTLTDLMSGTDYEGTRAESVDAPEDPVVRDLCERRGYGAVMDSAARQWFLRDPDGARVVGPCAGSVRWAMAGGDHRRLLELLDLMDDSGVRAMHFRTADLPEDPLVLALCERFGFEAVMDSAARQWFESDSTGSFVVGPAAAALRTARGAIAAAR